MPRVPRRSPPVPRRSPPVPRRSPGTKTIAPGAKTIAPVLKGVGRHGVAVAEELGAAGRLVRLADLRGREREGVQGGEEAAVGLVRPRDGAVALPAAAAQLVEAPV